jgi:signal transduction histidine kinase
VGAVAQRPARPSPKPTPAAGREGGAGSPATGLRSERDLARQWQRRAFDAVLAQGRERERIAAGLHDDIGQTLSVAALKLGELQLLAGAAPAQALIAELRQLLGQAIKATRSATFELSCPLLAQLGLHTALDSMVRRAEAQGGPRVRLRDPIGDTPLQEPVLGVVFRVARELVFNVCKHARAQHAELRLRSGPRGLMLTVADDGIGFRVGDPCARFGPHGGYGLLSAMAQVHAVGGRLVLRSRIGHGTVARLWVPALTGQHQGPTSAGD